MTEIVTRMKQKPYLLLKSKLGYPWGVSAVSPLGTEIHGPFYKLSEAEQYGRDLAKEFSDYDEICVVKIELPWAADI